MKIGLRFRLRTLLLLIALISIPMGWVAYQLNWVRQRHALMDRSLCWDGNPARDPEPPWPLPLFGEIGMGAIDVPESKVDEAKKLFPESQIQGRDDLPDAN
jgi:hypothetical protein